MRHVSSFTAFNKLIIGDFLFSLIGKLKRFPSLLFVNEPIGVILLNEFPIIKKCKTMVHAD